MMLGKAPKCCQCILDAAFEVDGVLTCEFHVGSVLKTLLALRSDAIVTAVVSKEQRG